MKRRKEQTSFGCLYSIWLGIVCTVLLIVNFELVKTIIEFLGLHETYVKAAQLLQFFVPVALIFIEFWIYDWLCDQAEMQNELDASDSLQERP